MISVYSVPSVITAVVTFDPSQPTYYLAQVKRGYLLSESGVLEFAWSNHQMFALLTQSVRMLAEPLTGTQSL